MICHRARALQDFAYALIKADMDTDFEDNCKEIIERRKKLTEKLTKPQECTAFDPKTNQIVSTTVDGATNSVEDKSMTTPTQMKKKKPKKKSRWSSGFLNKPRKPKSAPSTPTAAQKDEPSEEAHDNDISMEADNAEDSESEDELNESKEFKVVLIVSANLRVYSTTYNFFFQVDLKKLKQMEDDLVKRTDDFNTENLERIFAKLMECVNSYRKVYDRSQLVIDMGNKLDKLFPKSTPKKKNTPQK